MSLFVLIPHVNSNILLQTVEQKCVFAILEQFLFDSVVLIAKWRKKYIGYPIHLGYVALASFLSH